MYHDTDPIQMHCRHIHADGRRCGSPSLRNQNFCYYHNNARRPGLRQPQVKTLADRRNSTFDLPTPADLAERPGIQLALALILHKIAHNEIDPRRAGLLLYGLQIASMNLKPEPRAQKPSPRDIPPPPVEEIVHDELHGPLAPEAEWEEYQGPKGTLQRILDELDEEFGPNPENYNRPITKPGSLPQSHAIDIPLPIPLDSSPANPSENFPAQPLSLSAVAANPRQLHRSTPPSTPRECSRNSTFSRRLATCRKPASTPLSFPPPSLGSPS